MNLCIITPHSHALAGGYVFGAGVNIYIYIYMLVEESLDLLFLKFLFLGPPRLGKTTACHRLMGEIVDLETAGRTSLQILD